MLTFLSPGSFFYAQKGLGAFKDNGKSLLLTQSEQSLAESLVCLNQNQSLEFATEEFEDLHRKLRGPDRGARQVILPIPNSGMGVRLAEQRDGVFAIVHDNNPRQVKQGPWDVAAVKTILTEAGGVVLDSEGNDYDIYSGRPIIMSRSMKVAQELVALFGDKE